MKLLLTKLLITIGILLFMYSCSLSVKKENKTFLPEKNVMFDLQNKEETILMSDFVDSVEIIWLKLPDDETIGRATRVCFDDSNIFILDRQQQKVFHFDATGALLNELNKRGNGPGEYQSVYSCIAEEGIFYVFDKIGQNILLYDYSFKFIRSFHSEIWAENICLLPDGTFLCFTPQYIYNSPNGIWRMSDKGKYIQQLYSNNEKYPLVSNEWDPFYVTSLEGIGVRCPMKNEFYRYQDGKLSCVMKWSVQGKTTLDFPGVENCISVDEPFWVCPIFIDADQWIFGIWGEYNGGPSETFSLYSKQREEMHISSSLTADVGELHLMGTPVSANISNAMVAIVYDEPISGVTHEISLKSRNVLLIYHFRKNNISDE